MLDQDLQPHSAGGAVAPPRPFKSANNRSRAQGLLGPRNQLYEHTTGHERAFLTAERKGLRQRGGEPGAQQVSGWKTRSRRLLGLLQRPPGSWEPGKFASSKRFRHEHSAIPPQRGLSGGSWNHRVRNRQRESRSRHF